MQRRPAIRTVFCPTPKSLLPHRSLKCDWAAVESNVPLNIVDDPALLVTVVIEVALLTLFIQTRVT